MKKFVYVFILLIVNFLFCQQSFSATEKSFISEKDVLESAQFINEPEDVQKARFNAFQNVEYKIDPKIFEDYLIDKKFVAPPKKKGGKPKLKKRWGAVEIHSNNSYWVKYYNNPDFAYNYSSENGKLRFVEKHVYYEFYYYYNYCLHFIYDLNGDLQYIEHFWTDTEYKKDVVFDKNKIFKGFIKNGSLYDINNNKIKKTLSYRFF